MIRPNAIIKSITFNIKIDGVKYVDVRVKYSRKERLTLADIHREDNNSWKLVEIGGKTYDFQIYGDENNKSKPLRSELSIQLYEMYWDGRRLSHSSTILCSLEGTKITNVRIDTDQGRKIVRSLL